MNNLILIFIVLFYFGCSSSSKNFPDISLENTHFNKNEVKKIEVKKIDLVELPTGNQHIEKNRNQSNFNKLIYIKSNSSILRFCTPNIIKQMMDLDSYNVVISPNLEFLYLRIKNKNLLVQYPWDLFKAIKTVNNEKELEKKLFSNSDSQVVLSEGGNASVELLIADVKNNKKYSITKSDLFATVEIKDNKITINYNGKLIEKKLGKLPDDLSSLPSFCESIRL